MQPINLQQACTNLRHKLMYVDCRQQRHGMVDDSSDTRVFWCSKTMDQLGPDDEPVSPKDCTTSRDCHCASD